MDEKNSDIGRVEREELGANPSTSSSNSKHETNRSAVEREPRSDLIVWWDEPEDRDPENPMNWSSTRKWVNILTISTIGFLV